MNWREADRSRLPVAPAIPDKWSAAVCNRPDRPAPDECVCGQAIAALAGACTAKRSCRRSSPTIAIRHRPPRSYRRRGIEMSPKQRRLPRRPEYESTGRVNGSAAPRDLRAGFMCLAFTAFCFANEEQSGETAGTRRSGTRSALSYRTCPDVPVALTRMPAAEGLGPIVAETSRRVRLEGV
jgi:hypothetical protein